MASYKLDSYQESVSLTHSLSCQPARQQRSAGRHGFNPNSFFLALESFSGIFSDFHLSIVVLDEIHVMKYHVKKDVSSPEFIQNLSTLKLIEFHILVPRTPTD